MFFSLYYTINLRQTWQLCLDVEEALELRGGYSMKIRRLQMIWRLPTAATVGGILILEGEEPTTERLDGIPYRKPTA